MIKFRGSLFLVFLPLLPTLAVAGAWTQERGKYQLISSVNIYQAHYYFDATGNRQPQAAFIKQEFSQYAEYGLRDGITIGGQTSIARASQNSATTNSNSNLGDSEVFVRYRAWQKGDTIFSLEPSLTLPSPDSKTDRPKIGGDNYSVTLRGNVGRSFRLFGKSHFADMSIGYNHRIGRPNDQLKLDSTLGINLTERWQIMPQTFITRAVGNRAMTTGFTQSTSDDYDLAKLQLSVLYQLNEKTRLQLGAYANTAGRNTGNGHGFIAAFWRNF